MRLTPDPDDPLNNLPACSPDQLVEALNESLDKAIAANARKDLAGNSYHVNFAIDIARELRARWVCRCDEADDTQDPPAAVRCPLHDRDRVGALNAAARRHAQGAISCAVEPNEIGAELVAAYIAGASYALGGRP